MTLEQHIVVVRGFGYNITHLVEAPPDAVGGYVFG